MAHAVVYSWCMNERIGECLTVVFYPIYVIFFFTFFFLRHSWDRAKDTHFFGRRVHHDSMAAALLLLLLLPLLLGSVIASFSDFPDSVCCINVGRFYVTLVRTHTTENTREIDTKVLYIFFVCPFVRSRRRLLRFPFSRRIWYRQLPLLYNATARTSCGKRIILVLGEARVFVQCASMFRSISTVCIARGHRMSIWCIGFHVLVFVCPTYMNTRDDVEW